MIVLFPGSFGNSAFLEWDVTNAIPGHEAKLLKIEEQVLPSEGRPIKQTNKGNWMHRNHS